MSAPPAVPAAVIAYSLVAETKPRPRFQPAADVVTPISMPSSVVSAAFAAISPETTKVVAPIVTEATTPSISPSTYAASSPVPIA